VRSRRERSISKPKEPDVKRIAYRIAEVFGSADWVKFKRKPTSNRPLEDWGKLLGDVPAASAILDRFLHRAHTIAITGRSYRLKDQTAPKDTPTPKDKKEEPNEP